MTADLDLDIEIRTFEVDAGAGIARIELAAKLVSPLTGRTLAAKIFQATAPAAGEGPAAAEGLDQALGQVLGDIVRWSAAYI